MNILFTYCTPFNPLRGGIGRVTDTLTREFQRREHQVFYLISPTLLQPFGVKDTETYSFPTPINYLPEKDVTSQTNIKFYLDFLRNNAIDIVINQSGSSSDSLLWVKSHTLNIPIISCIHSSPLHKIDCIWEAEVIPLKSDDIIEKLKRLARIVLYPRSRWNYYKSERQHYNFILPATTKLCLLSERFYPNIKRLKLKDDYSQKLCAVPNPNSYPAELKIDLSKKKRQLLYVGLINSAKGVHRIIDLWEKLYLDFPEWEMIIVGGGDEALFKRLKRKSSNLPRIRFEGFKDPLSYYKEASVLCMTSNYEGWGMVLTEAMQCGTVPVAFNSFASVQDIINDGINGYLISPFDLKEYEQKLRTLMTDTSQRQEMAKEAITAVQQFDIIKVADKWEQLFKSI